MVEIEWALQGEQRITLIAEPTTGGGSALENKYGLDFCLSKVMTCCGPVV